MQGSKVNTRTATATGSTSRAAGYFLVNGLTALLRTPSAKRTGRCGRLYRATVRSAVNEVPLLRKEDHHLEVAAWRKGDAMAQAAPWIESADDWQERPVPRQRHRTQRAKVKPGAALASLRRTSWHACLSCGKRFSGIKTAKFCSNACRQRAKYAKRREYVGGEDAKA